MSDNSKSALVSAQGQDNQSMLFFVNKYGDIACFMSQKPTETQVGSGSDQMEYTQKSLQVNGKNVATGSKDLDAINWEDAKYYYTRIYYADATETLREICLDVEKANPGNAKWTVGMLSEKKVKVKKNTSITSHINLKANQLKVYFFSGEADKANDSKPVVAWHPIGSGSWEVLNESI